MEQIMGKVEKQVKRKRVAHNLQVKHEVLNLIM